MKKRFTSMLLAILTVLSLFSTTALAADAPQPDVVRGSRINIAEGSTSIPASVKVTPAYFDGQNLYYSGSINKYVVNTNGSATINLYAHVSTSETNSLLSDFYTAAGENANVWIVESIFDIYNDVWGSYGKYYKMTPYGQYLFQVDADGTKTYNLTPDTSSYYDVSITTYYAVENTSSPYTIGISGGYYYYNNVNHSIQSKAVGTLVIFNDN
jgi:hypothetical protein